MSKLVEASSSTSVVVDSFAVVNLTAGSRLVASLFIPEQASMNVRRFDGGDQEELHLVGTRVRESASSFLKHLLLFPLDLSMIRAELAKQCILFVACACKRAQLQNVGITQENDENFRRQRLL